MPVLGGGGGEGGWVGGWVGWVRRHNRSLSRGEWNNIEACQGGGTK